MFSKGSRYRSLPDVVTTDSRGRSLRSRAIRLLPEVEGSFRHTVDEGDRLDHLAYRYYKQPRKWWRICDANPGVMSPLALLGKERLVSHRFPLSWDDGDGQPPWAELRQQLQARVGVVDLQLVEEVKLIPIPEVPEAGQEPVTVIRETCHRAVIVVHNDLNVSATELTGVIESTGFEADKPELVGRVGKSIVIPPDIVG
jgi:hypothetical protein